MDRVSGKLWTHFEGTLVLTHGPAALEEMERPAKRPGPVSWS